MVLVLTRLVAALAALGVATAVTTAGTAGADPTPTPGPNYQIPTPNGPAFPGVQTYPPGVPEACWRAGSHGRRLRGLGSREASRNPSHQPVLSVGCVLCGRRQHRLRQDFWSRA